MASDSVDGTIDDLLELNQDGTARRYDGVRLNPASGKPWYVLATAHGEKTEADINRKLHDRNMKIWNRFVLDCLGDADRSKMRANFGLVHKLKEQPISIYEKMFLQKQLDNRSPGYKLSDLQEACRVDFAETVFNENFCLDGFVFTKTVDFSRSLCLGALHVEKCPVLSGANFKGAIIKRNAYFREGLFAGPTSFHSTEFASTVTFRNATFYNKVEFFHAHFKGRAYFEETNFFSSGGKTEVPQFNDCIFDLAVSFRNTYFRDAVPNMREALLPDRVEFTPMDFCWPKKNSRYKTGARETFAALCHAMERRGLKDHAHFFFRKEMRCRENTEEGWDKIALFLYRQLSNYGYSVKRPVWALASVVLMGAIVTSFSTGEFSCIGLKENPEPTCLSKILLGVLQALALSFSNTLSFLGFKGYFLELK